MSGSGGAMAGAGGLGGMGVIMAVRVILAGAVIMVVPWGWPRPLSWLCTRGSLCSWLWACSPS